MDKQRFEDLWSRCAGSGDGAGERFDEIERHYQESHRRYHTPEHVEHCLEQFDAAREHLDAPDAVELAVWYHDVIYDVKSRENELESARLFQRRARDRVPGDQVDEVVALIMVTVHTRIAPETTDQAFMVDIDLSSFGLPWDRFITDSIAVRDEFAHLSDAEFFPKQRDFLRSLLARDSFCYTEFFRRRHEQQARRNIEGYLRDLEQRGLI